MKGKTAPTEIYEVLGERGHALGDGHKHFADGLNAYRRLAFDKALGCFRKGCGDDPLCGVFAERCERLLVTPPPEDWDGVWHLETK